MRRNIASQHLATLSATGLGLDDPPGQGAEWLSTALGRTPEEQQEAYADKIFVCNFILAPNGSDARNGMA